MPKWFPEIFKKKEPKPELVVDLTDQRLMVQPLGMDWLCPYSLKRLPTPDWDGNPDNLLNSTTIVTYLNSLLQNVAVAPTMKEWVTVMETAVAMRLADSPNYKLTTARGEWICPYCAENTSIPLAQWDGTAAPVEWFLPEAMKHLRTCAQYIKDPLAAKSVREINGSRGQIEVKKQLMRRVAEEPIFRVCDDWGAWVCPFAQIAIEHINLNEMDWDYETQALVVDYLASAKCPGHAYNWATSITVPELQRIAANLSKERAVRASQDAAEQELSRMRQTVDQTQASVQEIRRDLEAARKAQLKLLPEGPPTIPGYEIYSFYEPSAELGGDLYDFLDAGKGRTGFLIGDVSGHGVEAAVIMSAALKSFEARSTGIASPAAVMKDVNTSLLKDIHRGKFVSAFYGTLEHSTGKMLCSRAGHPPAMLVNAAGEFNLIEGKGLALGIGKTETFAKTIEEYEIKLEPGSVLLLYTDGIPEAMNANNDEFTDEKLQEVFYQNSTLPAKEVVENIIAAVREHVGNLPMADDLTLVVVKKL